uniref:DUF4794 domain-containing protein n=1 Tax=Panagrellus redivivus TaxID=6233 RepID=A0A7E4VS42_PANRE
MQSLTLITLAAISLIFTFHSITAMPLLAQIEKMPEQIPMADDYVDPLSADKRDLEEAYFLTPPEKLAVLLQLPRTDRKFFDADPDYYPIASNAFTFDSLPIEIEQQAPVPKPAAAAPSQKEVTGPIVLGPQTKSTVTNSLKKP